MALPRLPRLNLQFFANQTEGEGETTTDEAANADTTPETAEETNGEGSEEAQYTKSDVEKLIKDRLDREQKKQEKKREQERQQAERERLKENEEYRELAESLQAQLDEQKTQVHEAHKTELLRDAGYTAEQAERYKKFIVGESDEDLTQAVQELTEDIPPRKTQYVDPSTGNPAKEQPQPKGGEDVGHDLFSAIKKAGKFRKK